MTALGSRRDRRGHRLGQTHQHAGDAAKACDEGLQLGLIERDGDLPPARCRRLCRFGGPVHPAGAAVDPKGDLGQPAVAGYYLLVATADASGP